MEKEGNGPDVLPLGPTLLCIISSNILQCMDMDIMYKCGYTSVGVGIITLGFFL